MAGWALVAGVALGIVAVGLGILIGCVINTKKRDRQAEIEFSRLKLAEQERERHSMGSMMKVSAE